MKAFPIFLFLLILGSAFILAAPPELPMIISGNASINDDPAEQGIKITARANGEIISETKTNDDGEFNMLLQKLENGQEADFYVDGIDAEKSISYKSGDFRQLTLKVEKPYKIYYFGGAFAALLAGILIWKRKSIFTRKKA